MHVSARAQAFYESYYHPSNARFWFYGDDPHEERLRLLDAYLQVGNGHLCRVPI